MSRRKSFDRKRKTGLKRRLAERDLLVPPGIFDQDRNPYVRCSECDGLVLFDRITMGHRLPLGMEGSNDPENLRLECRGCNLRANKIQILKNRASRQKSEGISKELDRRQGLLSKLRGGRLYESVRVLDVHGRQASFTSRKQSEDLQTGKRVQVVDRGADGKARTLQLVREIPLGIAECFARPNRCVICDAERYLIPFSYWPRWHPEWRGARKTYRTAPVCQTCVGPVQQHLERLADAEHEGPLGARPHRAEIACLLELRGRLANSLTIPSALSEALECYGLEPEISFNDLSRRIRELKHAQRALGRTRRERRRKDVLSQKTDFHALFWEFARHRRGELGPYLRTDSSWIDHLEAHLRDVMVSMSE